LHFHDLRHEGISRLFEVGRSIPQVAAVSGHRSWQSLQRYAHLRQTGDKYAGWKWLAVVSQKADDAGESTDDQLTTEEKED
jgi:integrase